MTFPQRLSKRTFDLIVSACGIIILFPLFAALCILVKVSSPGSMFFRQERIGRYGKPFSVIKFRTMYIGSEKGGTITSSADSRITPIGMFLRTFKLDELPQLTNVFIGKMSFVGPRPDVPGYADCLKGDDRIILSLRPGITGLATLYFRYEEELLAQAADPKKYNDEVLWPIKVRLNREYLENWSFLRDIAMIAVTILPVLNRVLAVVPPSPKNVKDIQ